MDATKLHRFLSDSARTATRNEIRELLKLIAKPDMISLAGGLPAPASFPVEELKEVVARVLDVHGTTALQYGPTEGDVGLRELLLDVLEHDGRTGITIENVLVTTASQQALDLCARIFLAPGDAVMCGSPSYLGALGAFTACGARLCGVPLDDEGMRTDLLEHRLLVLRRDGVRPKFVYVVPDFQNPAGVTLSLQRRHELLSIAREFDLLVLEDNPYRELRYTGETPPSLGALDRDGRVITLYSFSKVFCPGLRLGYVVADPSIITALVLAKQPVDLCTSSFNQFIAREYIAGGHLWKRLERTRALYAHKREVMLAALGEHIDPSWGVRWTRPEGGMFVWMTLPVHLDARDLFAKAIERNVAFVVGSAFHCDNRGKNTLRLNFSFPSPEQLQTAVKRLADAIGDLLCEKPVPPPAAADGKRGFSDDILAEGDHALDHLPLNLALHEVLQ
jgi:2-aminoadipate transaminase